MAASDEKTGNFTVNDRRAFDPSGERKPDPPAVSANPAEVAPPVQEPNRPLPPADFATLVLSLGSSAMMYLGESDPALGKQPTRNLAMAKHAIDLLTVLEEKTKGNLSSEEEQILESLLFDLRLRYVEALKVPPAGA